MRHPLSDSLSFLWGLKIWNSLLAGNAAWKSPGESRLMINLLPIAARLSDADGEKVGRSLFTRVSGAFSQTVGQVFSSLLVRERVASVLVNRWKDTNVGKWTRSDSSMCPSCTCWSGTRTCAAGFGNLLRLMKAAAKKWAEGLQMFLISGLKLIWLFVIGSVKLFCRKSGRSRLQIKQEDQNSTET